jgi:hypothetical protein
MAVEEKEGTGMKLNLCLAILLFPAIALADSSAIIVQGLGQSEEYDKKFSKWATGIQSALVQDLGFAKDRVVLLSGDNTRKASIEKAFEQMKTQVKPQDTFLLFLIGSGAYDMDAATRVQEYKLSVMGQDLTGTEYGKLIDSLSPGRSVVVAGSDSSGGLFERISARNRVIVASSRATEKEPAVFYEYFVEGLKGLAADEDKDKKVSIWEAFKYANAGVERFFKEKTLIQTEHGGVAANGAPQVAANVADQEIPVLARVTSINADRAVVVSDPRLQALLNEKKAIEQSIEDLRLQKALMTPDEYDKRLEGLIIDLTRKNQQIQAQEPKK